MSGYNVGIAAATGVALVAMLGATRPVAAQDETPYPEMAPVEQYLMDSTAEIALARSAAPASISDSATILILGREGYQIAMEGTNGFVCLVDRAWSGPFDWPEFWNPRVRAAGCLNPQAARSIVPIDQLRTRMVLAGRSRAELVSALKAAFVSNQLPRLESGAMAYMMSPSAYLTDEGGHNLPHLMFYTLLENGADWGSGAEGSPVLSSPFWFFAPEEDSRTDGLEPMLVFLVGTTTWSDGTPVAP